MALERLFNKILNNTDVFRFPTEAPASSVPTKELGKEDYLDLLSKEDDNVKPEVKTELPEEEEPKEEEGLELADEAEPIETDEEKFIAPPTRKEILKKYPDIFKDFPQLQSSFYRERKYSELLPTIEDAEQAVEKAENYDRFEASLLEGKADDILKTVKNTSQESYDKLVADYLPALQRVDNQAHLRIVSDLVSHVLNFQYNQGKANQDADLVTAVEILNEKIFGSKRPAAPQQNQQQNNPEAEKLKLEREKFQQERFQTAQTDITTKLDNRIKSTISLHIDPKSVMTDYIKNTAIEKANLELERLVQQDSRFIKIYDGLWEKAFKDNFSRASMEKISQAYLSKARTLLPTVIQKSRNEALKGLGKKVADDDRDKKGPLPPGRSTSQSKSTQGTKNKVPPGMSSLEYLMKD